jgi:hypothetical protein
LALLAVVIATLALRRLRERQAPGRTVLALALAAVAGALTAFCNPWGKAGVIWLLKSVSWSRPAIAEWNPTAFGWDHAPFFLLMGLAVFALLGAPRNRRGAWWTWAVLALLAAAALRYVRHTPLFAIAAVAFLPGPLHGALGRWKGHAPSLLTAVRARWFRFAGTSVLLASSCAGSILSPWKFPATNTRWRPSSSCGRMASPGNC